MPKTRVKRSAGQKAVPVQVKFKLGGRKNQTSALSLSTDELLDRYAKGGKDVRKIVQVLQARGVKIPGKEAVAA